ncbi:Gephyrin [Sphaceloma murrayae]|uniref:Gephyrin n=1 Tax=Sphaceloma murrayae TaxID=2082308 RepID=A0A2K1QUQ4_9PEZI|nr:Gephyrin [Sphaceloma murrayae]
MTVNLKAAILVVSDTASKDPSTDKCESTLREVFQAATSATTAWEISQVAIVPDDALAIQRQVTQWTDQGDPVHLVVTSGGTGFTGKDITPEAITPLLHKQAPGLVHGMLASSLSVTPFAIMARPVAGVRNRSLILTLPGSPKGARENLEAVIKLLAHACQQAAGANSRELHAGGTKALEQQAGLSSTTHSHDHSHGHHHHSHGHSHGHHGPKPHTTQATPSRSLDPSTNPTARHRSSPYPMLPVSEALSLISTHIPLPRPITLPLSPSLLPSILASPIQAPSPVPAFRASIVDGYAIRLPCPSGIYPVTQISHAQLSSTSPIPLETGQVARITTGAPLPPGADAVVMVEDTRLASTTPSGDEEHEIEILTSAISKGENVREVGSDVAAGSVLLGKGEQITALGGEFGLLASTGVREVAVYRRPRVGVLSTGDELVGYDTGRELRLGEVRDTNRPTLLAAIANAGFEGVDLGIAPDTPDGLEGRVRAALREVDVLVTSGGVSMGEKDLLKGTIEGRLGGKIHFGRVSMKPGKPTTFATVEIKGNGGEAEKKVVFGLPGNPASAVVTFQLFVLAALHGMMGREERGLAKVGVMLGETVRGDKARQEYVRAVVSVSKDGGLVARATGGQRSSRIGSFKGANALLVMPLKDEVKEGERVEAMMMGPILGETALA